MHCSISQPHRTSAMAARRAASASAKGSASPADGATPVLPQPDDDISWQYPLLLASVFATCGSAVLIPFRQGRLDDLGCTKLCLGAVQSSRSALQLVGSPALGALRASRPALFR